VRSKIEALERERDGARKRYKAELSVQARFNSANNNSILRLREKFVSFNEKIKSLNSLIEQFLSDVFLQYQREDHCYL
jgi:predicted RNase H-like nuclease (RuvC/YqgF family)